MAQGLLSMKKVGILVVFGFLFMSLNSCVYSFLKKSDAYQEMNNLQYQKEISEGRTDNSINILDIRTTSEYEKSHIECALNSSLLNKEFKDKIRSFGLDPTKPTYIYCETQHRSHFAARIMIKKLGFTNIIDLDKGMMRWRKDGLPYIDSDSISGN